MKPTDIALKYLAGMTDAVRKKNAAKFGKKAPVETVESDAMGGSEELGEEDISALLAGGDSEMGEEMGSGEHSMPADDQAMMGDDPKMGLFDKKKKFLTKG